MPTSRRAAYRLLYLFLCRVQWFICLSFMYFQGTLARFKSWVSSIPTLTPDYHCPFSFTDPGSVMIRSYCHPCSFTHKQILGQLYSYCHPRLPLPLIPLHTDTDPRSVVISLLSPLSSTTTPDHRHRFSCNIPTITPGYHGTFFSFTQTQIIGQL